MTISSARWEAEKAARAKAAEAVWKDQLEDDRPPGSQVIGKYRGPTFDGLMHLLNLIDPTGPYARTPEEGGAAGTGGIPFDFGGLSAIRQKLLRKLSNALKTPVDDIPKQLADPVKRTKLEDEVMTLANRIDRDMQLRDDFANPDLDFTPEDLDALGVPRIVPEWADDVVPSGTPATPGWRRTEGLQRALDLDHATLNKKGKYRWNNTMDHMPSKKELIEEHPGTFGSTFGVSRKKIQELKAYKKARELAQAKYTARKEYESKMIRLEKDSNRLDEHMWDLDAKEAGIGIRPELFTKAPRKKMEIEKTFDDDNPHSLKLGFSKSVTRRSPDRAYVIPRHIGQTVWNRSEKIPSWAAPANEKHPYRGTDWLTIEMSSLYNTGRPIPAWAVPEKPGFRPARTPPEASRKYSFVPEPDDFDEPSPEPGEWSSGFKRGGSKVED